MIEIRSKSDGFRRCGIAHSKAPVVYPDDRFTDEELRILQGEPMLKVRILEEVEPDDDDTARAWLNNQSMTYLRNTLDELEVEYPARPKKSELVELVMNNTAPVPEDV